MRLRVVWLRDRQWVVGVFRGHQGVPVFEHIQVFCNHGLFQNLQNTILFCIKEKGLGAQHQVVASTERLVVDVCVQPQNIAIRELHRARQLHMVHAIL